MKTVKLELTTKWLPVYSNDVNFMNMYMNILKVDLCNMTTLHELALWYTEGEIY